MSKVAELAYDIEQLYIEGYSPKTIAMMLECPIEMVYGWIEGESLNVADQPQEDYDPYETINS
jgi:DNA-directed RNA polymerase specialized sigma24 family protein